jgi:hypothetical protein
MAIESVSTATFAPPQARSEQTTQANQADQTRQAREPRQAGGTGRENEATETSPPPVVNTQGQVTGKIINAIA